MARASVTPGTPTRTRTVPSKTAQASPQVRAALQALRKKHAAENAPKPQQEIGEFSVPDCAKPKSETVSNTRDHDLASSFGLVPTRDLISKASTTGRLNLSSRSIGPTLPSEIYAYLLPRSSLFHPSNREPPKHFSSKIPAKSADFNDDSTRWYETTDLLVLKASNNEIIEVQDSLGGFDQLQILDLHANQIPELPASIGLLTNLTTLDISKNNFQTFPIQLAALDNLTELDLSGNKLKSLWDNQWRTKVKSALQHAKPEDSTISPDSSAGEDFWTSFPSSPMRSRTISSESVKGATKELSDPATPFPLLRKLNLSDNPDLIQTLHDLKLPPLLTHLDLCKIPFGKKLPLARISPLTQLQHLNFFDCELVEEAFEFQSPPGSFRSLLSLDVSKNGIDSLATLEALFGPKIQWKHLPPAVIRVIGKKQFAAMSEGIEINVVENFLRDEARRRRDINLMAAAAADAEEENLPPQPVRTTGKPKKVELEDAFQSLNMEESDSTDQIPTPTASTSQVAQSDLSPELSALLTSYDSTTYSLNLSNKSIKDLSAPETPSGPPVSILNLSRNLFKSAPLSSLSAWGWSESLTILDLSNNRLTSLSDSSSAQLPNLTKLNLTNNALSSAQEVFTCLASLAPKLESLDLTYNRLATVEGIENVLAPADRAGLKILQLTGNKLADITPLANLGTDFKEGKASLHWRCEELDLRDNEISKLPPELALLPSRLEIVHVSGNTFRVPARRVYEVGGWRDLRKWLADRIA